MMNFLISALSLTKEPLNKIDFQFSTRKIACGRLQNCDHAELKKLGSNRISNWTSQVATEWDANLGKASD
jgi:hypothetical protein